MILKKNCSLLLHAARSPSTSMSPVTMLFLWGPPPCGDGVTTIVTPGPTAPLLRNFSGDNSCPFRNSAFPITMISEMKRISQSTLRLAHKQILYARKYFGVCFSVALGTATLQRLIQYQYRSKRISVSDASYSSTSSHLKFYLRNTYRNISRLREIYV